MSKRPSTVDSPTLPWIYRAILLWTALESVAVFIRPVGFRLSHAGWKLYTSDAVLKSWVVDTHAVVAFMWIGIFLAQFELGDRIDRKSTTAGLHRSLGRFLLFGVVPLMSVLALWAMAMNPLGLSTFLATNMVFMWGISTLMFILGVVAIRRGDRRAHADAMYVAFVTLSAVSTYRVVLIATFVTTGMFMTTLPAVLTWVVVLLKIGVPLVHHRRARSNRFALVVLVGAFAIFAVWGLGRGLMSVAPPPVLER